MPVFLCITWPCKNNLYIDEINLLNIKFKKSRIETEICEQEIFQNSCFLNREVDDENGQRRTTLVHGVVPAPPPPPAVRNQPQANAPAAGVHQLPTFVPQVGAPHMQNVQPAILQNPMHPPQPVFAVGAPQAGAVVGLPPAGQFPAQFSVPPPPIQRFQAPDIPPQLPGQLIQAAVSNPQMPQTMPRPRMPLSQSEGYVKKKYI